MTVTCPEFLTLYFLQETARVGVERPRCRQPRLDERIEGVEDEEGRARDAPDDVTGFAQAAHDPAGGPHEDVEG